MFNWNEFRSLNNDFGSAKHAEVSVSVLIPAHRCADVLDRTVLETRNCLKMLHPGDFEIILIPNGACEDTYEIAHALATKFPLEVKVAPHYEPRGKGAALRTGLSRCRGRWIFLMDADLPYGLAFFPEALRHLKKGADLVSANRRHPESRFNLPASLMQSAYLRHCLSLIFNSLVRFLLKIKTNDTQAGIKAMSRRFAHAAFSRQACPGFLYDLELFICCRENNFRQVEIPVVLFLNSEKSTVQLIRDGLLALFWIFRIFCKMKAGAYAVQEELQQHFEPTALTRRI